MAIGQAKWWMKRSVEKQVKWSDNMHVMDWQKSKRAKVIRV